MSRLERLLNEIRSLTCASDGCDASDAPPTPKSIDAAIHVIRDAAGLGFQELEGAQVTDDGNGGIYLYLMGQPRALQVLISAGGEVSLYHRDGRDSGIDRITTASELLAWRAWLKAA